MSYYQLLFLNVELCTTLMQNKKNNNRPSKSEKGVLYDAFG